MCVLVEGHCISDTVALQEMRATPAAKLPYDRHHHHLIVKLQTEAHHDLRKIRQVREIDREIKMAGLVGNPSLIRRKPVGLHSPNMKRGGGKKEESVIGVMRRVGRNPVNAS